MPPTAVESLLPSSSDSSQGPVSHQHRFIAVLDRSSTGGGGSSSTGGSSSGTTGTSSSISDVDTTKEPNRGRRPFPYGLVLDHFCSDDNSSPSPLLNAVDAIRSSLPLDSKRPTVDRRFYCDADRQIVTALQVILYEAIDMICSKQSMLAATAEVATAEVTTVVEEPTLVQPLSGHRTTNCGGYGDADAAGDDEDDDTNNNKNRISQLFQQTQPQERLHRLLFTVHCNQYLRILEYTTIGGSLVPHTDGTKVCDVTQRRSTHTLLLYLTDCKVGGETVILDGRSGWSTPQTSVTAIPMERIYNDPPTSTGGCKQHVAGDTVTTCIQRIKLDAYEQSVDKTARKTKSDNGDDCAASTTRRDSHVSIGITPRRGRIFVMPHAWPHAGAPCQSVPKIMLRAEVTIELRV